MITLAKLLDVLHTPLDLFGGEEIKHSCALIQRAQACTSGEREVIYAAYHKGPLFDGDVPSKSARDTLLRDGLIAKVVVKGQDGYNALTYKGQSIYKLLDAGAYQASQDSELLQAAVQHVIPNEIMTGAKSAEQAIEALVKRYKQQALTIDANQKTIAELKRKLEGKVNQPESVQPEDNSIRAELNEIQQALDYGGVGEHLERDVSTVTKVKRLLNKWQTATQVLEQRGSANDKKLKQIFEMLPSEIEGDTITDRVANLINKYHNDAQVLQHLTEGLAEIDKALPNQAAPDLPLLDRILRLFEYNRSTNKRAAKLAKRLSVMTSEWLDEALAKLAPPDESQVRVSRTLSNVDDSWVGLPAVKTGGSFKHNGTIVADFTTTQGERRIVLEFGPPVSGMLHIYRRDQVMLAPRDRRRCVSSSGSGAWPDDADSPTANEGVLLIKARSRQLSSFLLNVPLQTNPAKVFDLFNSRYPEYEIVTSEWLDEVLAKSASVEATPTPQESTRVDFEIDYTRPGNSLEKQRSTVVSYLSDDAALTEAVQLFRIINSGCRIEAINGRKVIAICNTCGTPIFDGEIYQAVEGGDACWCMVCAAKSASVEATPTPQESTSTVYEIEYSLPGTRQAAIHFATGGTLSDAVRLFRETNPGYRIEAINDRDVIEICDACDAPIFYGQGYQADAEGANFCQVCVDKSQEG